MTVNQNDRWIQQNFGSLIDLYGGRYVAVAGQKGVAAGCRPETAERRARAAGCKGTPSVVGVPPRDRLGVALDPVRLFRLS